MWITVTVLGSVFDFAEVVVVVGAVAVVHAFVVCVLDAELVVDDKEVVVGVFTFVSAVGAGLTGLAVFEESDVGTDGLLCAVDVVVFVADVVDAATAEQDDVDGEGVVDFCLNRPEKSLRADDCCCCCVNGGGGGGG